MNEIKLRSKGYPYTYARVSVMRSKLLPKPEYQKLLKMKIESITRYMQDSSYKPAIDKLALDYKGADLIEQSLNLELVLTFAKLRRISAKEVALLIDAYAGRWDMHNIKTLIRGIYSKSRKDYVRGLLIPVGRLGMEDLEQLLKKDTIEDVLRHSPIFSYEKVKDAYAAFTETDRLIEIENRLDQLYYEKGLDIAKRVGKEGKLFAKFLLTEIDIINIRNLLRMKREGFERKDILRHLIFSGLHLGKHRLSRLAGSDSFDSLIESLKKTDYADILAGDVAESLIDAELELDRYLIKRSFLYTHQYPMTVMSILSYMLSKIMEVKNLKTLAKAKQLGIDDKYIEEKLIVV